MVLLTIHLASEARIGGPVYYRWMYPIERFLGKLKSYVRNRSHLEGSFAEGYVSEECLTFFPLYFAEHVETRHNKLGRNELDENIFNEGLNIFNTNGRALEKKEVKIFNDYTLIKAHQYVLSIVRK
ncbi:hypothetical protein MA16_Dca025867 [Dendrobium catenatum]|uniref:DUF4218 domain-containing protein n=1 Tax=Dendrobium catenatum TaxID=906689 RepID=A0A2I0WWB2_9ASPA|nr:hypothetical protein MA16_Dca025867 [Dendrobium catenatum]